MKKYNIKVNGVSYEVEVEEVGSAASSAPIQPAPAPASPAAAAKEPAPYLRHPQRHPLLRLQERTP